MSLNVLRKGWNTVALIAVSLTLSSCTMAMHYLRNGWVAAPPASEFGLGPRTSASGKFVATVKPSKALSVGPLQAVRLELVDPNGQPLDGASITVDGGMPQHGHGLPTKPRITGTEPNGVYVVDGVRFNMAGWWELRFAVSSGAATDSVTFNIRL